MKTPKIPDDFELEKYNALESYSKEQLYRELLWRYRLWKKLNEAPDKVIAHFAKHSDSLGQFEHFIFDLPLKADGVFKEIENPLFFRTNRHYSIFDDTLAYHRQKMSERSSNSSECITSFTVGEFNNLVDSAQLRGLLEKEQDIFEEDDFGSGLNRLEFKALLKTADGSSPQKVPLDFMLSNQGRAIVNVDFSRSNEALLNAFNDFIIEYRKKVIQRVEHPYSLDAEFSEEKLLKWHHRYKTIPCIDLLLWGKFNKIHLTQQLLADALRANDTDQVRRTILPWVNGLLTPIALNALRSQIS